MIEITAESDDTEPRKWTLGIDGYEVSEERRPGRWQVESGLSPGKHTISFGIDSPSLYKCSLSVEDSSAAFILNGSNDDKNGFEMIVNKYD